MTLKYLQNPYSPSLERNQVSCHALWQGLGVRKFQLMRSGSVQPSMPPAMVVGQPVSAPCQSSRIAAAGVAVSGHGNTVTLMRLTIQWL